MKWLHRGLQLGQAVKNAQRLRHILATFTKHGFVDIVDRMHLGKFLPSRLQALVDLQGESTPQERMRRAFEELGPTFVKLGQLLSTRPDLIPESYIEEFTKLQDNVHPLSFDTIKSAIETELEMPLDRAYKTFNPAPLAAASIAQVHEAVLLSGESVVVKVQRPGIEATIKTDISLLEFLAGLLEKYVPESRLIGPKVIVQEFFKMLTYELDFVIEANNIAKISHNMLEIPEIVIPKVFKSLSTRRILTLERLQGIRVNDSAALDAAGIDRAQIVSIGARGFFKSVLIDGLFHGDLHGGNLFVLPGNRLGIIDFGIVGRLSQKSRDQLANMVMYLLSEDYENLCYEYLELGSSDTTVDISGFQREVRNTLSPHMGLSLNELNIGRVLVDATKIATKYNIKVPGDWMLVFKAILTVEGMARTLDPHFDLLKVGRELVKDIVKNQYAVDRIAHDFRVIAKDVGALMQVLPRQLRWWLKKLSANGYAIEVRSPELEEIRGQLEVNSHRQSLSILVVGLFIASSIALQYPSSHRIMTFAAISESKRASRPDLLGTSPS